MNLPKNLAAQLQKRIENQSLRKLAEPNDLIDFSSNDYLGFSKNQKTFDIAHKFLIENKSTQNGATGSRLISGNHAFYGELEPFLSKFHESESALVFNSGYDANIGFFSSVLQRGDLILYDEFSHASIRDGITMSNAKSYKFKHNDLEHLEEFLHKFQKTENIYVVTESVFSMDGDTPDLIKMNELIKKHKAYFVVDEAHAVGVFGESGKGVIQELQLQDDVFARIITFGKAIGCHGAAILGNSDLRQYLINFSRSFIYTTGLPPHSLVTIILSYIELIKGESQNELRENINFFKQELIRLELKPLFIESNSSIHSFVISGNERVKKLASQIQERGFEVKPILSPTVSEGEERIRFCLHSYNSKEEITNVLETLRIFVK
ncbi:MAG: pyridoxal phosphate-dependent aminotransferase family protein [Flavobacteriaceae bacterium]